MNLLTPQLQVFRTRFLATLQSLPTNSIDAIVANFPSPKSAIYPYLSHTVTVSREFKRVLKDPSWLYVMANDYRYEPTVKLDEKMGDRYQSKREKGIDSIRKDGSESSKENDILAAAAERLVVEKLGRQFDSAIYWHGDSADCYLHGASVDIKLRRRDGDDIMLLVNPSDKPKHVYILVSGSHPNNLIAWGYVTHQELTTVPRANFGYGKKLAMHCRELHPLDDLLELTGHPKPGEPMLLPYRIVTRLQADGWWLHSYSRELFLLSPSRYVPRWGKAFSRNEIAGMLPANSKVLIFSDAVEDERMASAIAEQSEVILIQR